MEFHSGGIGPSYGAVYIAFACVLWKIYQSVILALQHQLRTIPGPLLSAFTSIPLKIACLTGRRAVYIHSLHQQYGPYVRIAPREVAIADIEAFRVIHRIGSEYNKGPWYAGQHPSQTTDKNSGVFSILNNRSASHRRRLFQSAGTKKIVSEWEPQIIELADLAVEKINRDLKDYGTSDVMKWWTLMTSDVTGSLAFGADLNNLRNEKKNQMILDIEVCMPLIGLRAELPWTKTIMNIIPTWIPGSPMALFNRFTSYGQNAVKATRFARQGNNKTLF